jgi:hypothetical protein
VLDVDAPALRIIVATSLIIGASVAVSELLSRRGVEWSAIGLQFVVLAAVNSVLLGLYVGVLIDDVNRSLVLFFGVLLTMIVVLYDRFLGERAANPALS